MSGVKKFFAGLCIGIVNVVVDGDEPHSHPGEVHFCIEVCFNVVTTNTAHVLDQHRLDNASLNVCQQLLPARTVKVAAAVTVIRIVPTVGEAIVPGVYFQ